MSHKIVIILVLSIATIGTLSTFAILDLFGYDDPLQTIQNTIFNQEITDVIQSTDEVFVKKDIHLRIFGTQEGERGRIEKDQNNSNVILNSTLDATDSLQISGNSTNSTGVHHVVVINDGVKSTTPP